MNQLQADAELFEKIQTVRAERARLKRKEDIIGDMRGKPKHDVVSEDIIKRVESPSGKVKIKYFEII